MHEIVTIQLGQQANYVGTHYWNTQESYFTYSGEEESIINHDISFRAGIGADGNDTYTPRTLIYDLKGAFGTLRRETALYATTRHALPTQDSPWSGSTIPLQLAPITPSPYQQALDDGTTLPALTTSTVRYWSDYNHVFYHPRTAVQLSEYELNSSLLPFEQWDKGEELFVNLDKENDLLDRDLRPFLEECDQVQAIQFFTSIDDAWGGFASKYLETISDELGKGCHWVFGMQNAQRTSRAQQALRAVNTAQSLRSLNTVASIHIPITSSVAYRSDVARLDVTSFWHTSAIQAAAIESITLPARLRATQSSHTNFNAIEATINNDGRHRLASLSMSVSNPAQSHTSIQVNGDHRLTNGHTNGTSANAYSSEDEDTATPTIPPLDIAFLPSPPTTTHPSSRRAPSHMLSSTTIYRTLNPPTTNPTNPPSNLRNPFQSRALTSTIPLLFPLLSSYPSIFPAAAHPSTSNLSITARLAAETAIASWVRGIEGVARRVMSVDEREAVCEELVGIAERFEEGLGSEFGDPD